MRTSEWVNVGICVFECVSMSVYETECKYIYMSLSGYKCKCVDEWGYTCAFEHECTHSMHVHVCACVCPV